MSCRNLYRATTFLGLASPDIRLDGGVEAHHKKHIAENVETLRQVDSPGEK